MKAKEWGGTMMTTSDMLEGAQIDPLHCGEIDPSILPPMMLEIILHSHDRAVEDGVIPAGTPRIMQGPRQQEYRDLPCPTSGNVDRCVHQDDDDDWPHTEPTGRYLYLLGWHRVVEDAA